MERENGSLQVVAADGRKGVVIETAGAEMKVRWEDGVESWITLDDAEREQASSEVSQREIGS